MSVVEASVEIDAPPERVWEVVANPNYLPLWEHRIAAVEGVPPDGVQKGTEYTTEVQLMRARARVNAKILELRPREYAKIRLTGLVIGTVETWLDPLDRSGTRLRHRVEYRFKGGPLGRLAARGVKLLGASMLLRRGTEAQKRQVENRTA